MWPLQVFEPSPLPLRRRMLDSATSSGDAGYLTEARLGYRRIPE